MLLYGGDMNNVEPIYRLLNAEIDRKKFGLVIIRVCAKRNCRNKVKLNFFRARVG
jgi:hypothetical protein